MVGYIKFHILVILLLQCCPVFGIPKNYICDTKQYITYCLADGCSNITTKIAEKKLYAYMYI